MQTSSSPESADRPPIVSAPSDYPRITVVTPSFNQARYLEDTMESVHSPGYPNLEHIVMDGGSTDGSVEIIRRYEDRLAFWVSEQDGGQASAIEGGFARATGEILCWLNSDDVFKPWTLFEVADIFTRHQDVDFVYGDAEWIDRDGRILKPKREHRFNRFVFLWDHNFIPQPSSFWRRTLYSEVGGLDPAFNLAMDADLWARFSQRVSPVHIPRVWSQMRFYPEQKMVRLRHQNESEIQRVRARFGIQEPRQTDALRRFAARVLRIGLKTASRGYSWSEMRVHAGSAIRGGSWERRQERRSVAGADDQEAIARWRRRE